MYASASNRDIQIGKLICLNKVQAEIISHEGAVSSLLNNIIKHIVNIFPDSHHVFVSIDSAIAQASDGVRVPPCVTLECSSEEGGVRIEVSVCTHNEEFAFSDGDEVLLTEIATMLNHELKRYCTLGKDVALPWNVFLNSLAEAVLVVDPLGNVVFHNRSLEILLRRSYEEIKKKSLDELFVNAQTEAGQKLFADGGHQFLSAVLTMKIDSLRVNPDNTHDSKATQWLSLSARHFNHSQPDQEFFILTLRDISERKLDELEMRSCVNKVELEHALFETVLDVLPVGVMVSDKNGDVLRRNEAFAKIWGINKGDTPFFTSSAKTPSYESTMIRALKYKEYVSDEEKIFVNADGISKSVLCYAAPFFSEHGVLEGAVSAMVDISEIKRQQLELQRLAAMMNASTDAIVGISKEGKVLHWNMGAESLYGYKSEEIIGKSITMLCPEGDKGLIKEVLSGELKDKDVIDRDVLRLHKDNTIISVSTSLAVFRDDFGELLGYTVIERDIRPRKQLEQKLRHDAMHDNLTELPNRTVFLDHVEKSIARSERSTELFAVMVVDVDDFKGVNDSMGHLSGDELLIQVSKRLHSCLRPADTLARFGGDEFTILVENTESITVVRGVLDRILEQMKRPFVLTGGHVEATLSIGVAMWGAQHRTVSDILMDADKALYEVKSNGKGRYKIFDDQLRSEAETEKLKLSRLQYSVLTGDFVVNYQPIFDVYTGEAVSAEAFVRWSMDDDLLLPDQFMSLAENAGVIAAIDKTVLEKSCARLDQWRQLGVVNDEFFLSVNISQYEILDSEYANTLSGLIEKYSLPDGALVLEVSDKILEQGRADLLDRLNRLKRVGVGLCLDNFGVGISSLQVLSQLDADVIKLDREYLENIGDPKKAAFITALIGWGEEAGIKVVAEGVECIDKIRALSERGIRYVQGNYLLEVTDGSEVEATLSSKKEILS